MASPTHRSPRVGVAPAYQARGRTARRPQHRFNLKTVPYELQPLMIAPVLPGESLKTLMLQAQVWSDPLETGVMKNIGWWNEYFFFYVKHRDLMGYETDVDGLGKDLIDMFVTNESIASHQDADGNTWTYCPPSGVDFLHSAVQRITEEYFRDEGEAWNIATSASGAPLVKIFGRGASDWTEKLTLSGDYEDRRVEVPEYLNEMELAYGEWAAARDAGLIDMDYEDWMRTYASGAVVPNTDRVDYHRPENLCHFREFTYPTNTVEPTTGVPATAVGWRVASRANKAFFFPEPGWIIGLTCVRPKVYMLHQQGNVAAMMQTRDSWLPAVLNEQLNVSHLEIAGGTGPLAAQSGAEGWDSGYWIDLRDLLNHGDQFLNYAPQEGPPFVSLPATDGSRRYPSSDDVMQFFADTVDGRFLTDGVVSLSILGRQQERYKNLVLGQA